MNDIVLPIPIRNHSHYRGRHICNTCLFGRHTHSSEDGFPPSSAESLTYRSLVAPSLVSLQVEVDETKVEEDQEQGTDS